MGAHLRNIHFRICGRGGCYRTATQELRNTRNAIVNWYCPNHATAALRSFQKDYDE